MERNNTIRYFMTHFSALDGIQIGFRPKRLLLPLMFSDQAVLACAELVVALIRCTKRVTVTAVDGACSSCFSAFPWSALAADWEVSACSGAPTCGSNTLPSLVIWKRQVCLRVPRIGWTRKTRAWLSTRIHPSRGAG